MPDPPAITNPSLFLSKGLDAISGESLYFDESAPIASNNEDEVQWSSSAPPAIITSCLSILISSAACPIQCALVEHADEIE